MNGTVNHCRYCLFFNACTFHCSLVSLLHIVVWTVQKHSCCSLPPVSPLSSNSILPPFPWLQFQKGTVGLSFLPSWRKGSIPLLSFPRFLVSVPASSDHLTWFLSPSLSFDNSRFVFFPFLSSWLHPCFVLYWLLLSHPPISTYTSILSNPPSLPPNWRVSLRRLSCLRDFIPQNKNKEHIHSHTHSCHNLQWEKHCPFQYCHNLGLNIQIHAVHTGTKILQAWRYKPRILKIAPIQSQVAMSPRRLRLLHYFMYPTLHTAQLSSHNGPHCSYRKHWRGEEASVYYLSVAFIIIIFMQCPLVLTALILNISLIFCFFQRCCVSTSSRALVEQCG